jgi:RHS repeat-associated protein
MNQTKRPLLDRGHRDGVLLGLTLAVLLSTVVPAHAFHFPWDQGHDTTDWQDPSNPGPCEEPLCDPCASAGSPVYLPTGHLLWSENDLSIPGRPGLTLSRTYNSHDPRDGMFGKGWSSGCESGLFDFIGSELTEERTVNRYRGAVYRTSNGKRYTFRGSVTTGYQPPLGRHERITARSDGGFLLTATDGSSRGYNRLGQLTEEASPAGRVLRYTYDGSGRLQRMMDVAGRFIDFSYNSRGRVETVTDSAGRIWRYAYDSAGQLSSVTAPTGGIRRYEYRQYQPPGDAQAYSQLTRIIDETGGVLSEISYNGERVASYTVAQNRFTYVYNTTTRTVTKTDSTGSRWVYTYNTAGQITSLQDPLGGIEKYEYDGSGRMLGYVDALQQQWSWTYDAQGRTTTATNPAGEKIQWEYEGDKPNPVRAISPSGRITLATYDSHGSLSSLVDPAGARTTFVWGPDGNLKELRDALNQSTAVTTDSSGLPLKITDPSGRATTFVYDAAGRIRSITNGQGGALQFEYDALGRPTALIEPSGKRTVYARDAAGRITTVTDPAGRTTQYTYDTQGRMSARILSDGRSYQFKYRSDNLISEVVRPDGLTERYTYDAAKRITGATIGSESFVYGYDARHQLTSVRNATGTVSLTYDDVGRLTLEAFNGQSVSYTYNAEGERTSVTTSGGTTQFTLDARGLIKGISAPEGTYSLEYDALTRRTGLVYPNGTRASYGYNPANQLSQLRYTGPLTETLSYEYGDNGLLSRISSSQSAWTYRYDPDGQLISASSGDQLLSYQYDPAGNLLGDGRVYDNANRLSQDDTHTYAYDAAGNLKQKQDRSTGARTVYTWNELNQLVAVARYPDATAPEPSETTRFTYDPLQRRSSRTLNGVTERFVYDGLHRIATLDAASSRIEQVTYGPRIDEPLSLQGAQGSRYLHADHLGSIIAVTNGSALLGRYQYSPYGEQLSPTPGVPNSFRFAAREYEAEDLYYNRARYYDPQLRRFLSEDPLGLAGGDTNLYRYAANNPIHFSDPRGEAIWFAIPIIWAGIEVGLSIYDAYDTASTLLDPCKTAGEKWAASGLFIGGMVLPGGGYSAADDILTSKPVKEGIYEFIDTTGKKYVGQSKDVPRRLDEHVRSKKLDPNQQVDVTPMPGSTMTEREIAEHKRIQEITGGVPAKDSDLVSNKKDPIGPKRQHLLDD